MTLDENVEKELVGARERAEQGNASVMEAFLSAAKRYAQQVGQDISAQVKGIEKVGYEKAVPVELAQAERYAEKGHAGTMETYLAIAGEYARKANINIAKREAEIRALIKK